MFLDCGSKHEGNMRETWGEHKENMRGTWGEHVKYIQRDPRSKPGAVHCLCPSTLLVTLSRFKLDRLSHTANFSLSVFSPSQQLFPAFLDDTMFELVRCVHMFWEPVIIVKVWSSFLVSSLWQTVFSSDFNNTPQLLLLNRILTWSKYKKSLSTADGHPACDCRYWTQRFYLRSSSDAAWAQTCGLRVPVMF